MEGTVWEVLASQLSIAKKLWNDRIVYVHGKVDDALCRHFARMVDTTHGGRHEVHWKPYEDGYQLMLVDRKGVAREARDAAINMGMDSAEADRVFCRP